MPHVRHAASPGPTSGAAVRSSRTTRRSRRAGCIAAGWRAAGADPAAAASSPGCPAVAAVASPARPDPSPTDPTPVAAGFRGPVTPAATAPPAAAATATADPVASAAGAVPGELADATGEASAGAPSLTVSPRTTGRRPPGRSPRAPVPACSPSPGVGRLEVGGAGTPLRGPASSGPPARTGAIARSSEAPMLRIPAASSAGTPATRPVSVARPGPPSEPGRGAASPPPPTALVTTASAVAAAPEAAPTPAVAAGAGSSTAVPLLRAGATPVRSSETAPVPPVASACTPSVSAASVCASELPPPGSGRVDATPVGEAPGTEDTCDTALPPPDGPAPGAVSWTPGRPGAEPLPGPTGRAGDVAAARCRGAKRAAALLRAGESAGTAAAVPDAPPASAGRPGVTGPCTGTRAAGWSNGCAGTTGPAGGGGAGGALRSSGSAGAAGRGAGGGGPTDGPAASGAPAGTPRAT